MFFMLYDGINNSKKLRRKDVDSNVEEEGSSSYSSVG